MARKKRRTTRRSHRRRMSGVGGDLTKILVAIAGAVATRVIDNQVAKMTKPIDPKILAVAQVVLGAWLLPKFIKGDLGAAFGLGMAVQGGVSGLQAFKVISGFRDLRPIAGMNTNYLPYPQRQMINGVNNQTKSNFSGSRMSQMNTIGAMPDGSGECNPGY